MNYSIATLIAKFLVHFIIVPLFFMFLWDATMPNLFNLKTITYLQAMAIIFMSKIIFRNIQQEKTIDDKTEEEKMKEDILKFQELFEKYKQRITKEKSD